jgi:hypothetical protein
VIHIFGKEDTYLSCVGKKGVDMNCCHLWLHVFGLLISTEICLQQDWLGECLEDIFHKFALIPFSRESMKSMQVLTSHDFTQAGLIKTRLLGLIHVRTGIDTGTLKIRGCKDICSSII